MATADSELEEALTQPGTKKNLQELFRMCSAVEGSSQKDMQTITQSLTANIASIVQYSHFDQFEVG